jgi:hypothetical protein
VDRDEILIIAACLLLTGCDLPPPSQFIENCLESHVESYTRLQPMTTGKTTTFIHLPATRTVCDKSELVVNPRYIAWQAHRPLSVHEGISKECKR